MKCEKQVTMQQAVGMINDGDSLIATGFTIWRKPMALIYEMIRQKKRDLHVIVCNGAFDVDMLIGAGCIKAMEGNYCGFEIYGKIGNNFARALKEGKFIYEEWGHYHTVMRLEAGAIGVPFTTSLSCLGTDLLNPNYDMFKRAGLRDGKNPYIPREKFKIMKDPFFDGNDTVLLPAARANIAIALAQQVGEKGTVRLIGQKAADVEGMMAADKLIVLAEEIVPEEYLRFNAEENSLACLYPDAIVECSWGGHPSGVHGYYDADQDFITHYHQKGSRTQQDFANWAAEWIFGVKNFEEYLEKLGANRLRNLQANRALRYSTSIKRGVR
jgi:glutaconate CoA-transferase subunit A